MELLRVPGERSSWLGTYNGFKVKVFKQGIHWTHRVECTKCGMKTGAGPLMLAKRHAQAHAMENIDKDIKMSDPCEEHVW